MKATITLITGLGLGLACGDRSAVVERLADKYGEFQVAVEYVSEDTAGELWASEESGTWTVLVVNPHGDACIVSSGEGWVWKAVEASVDKRA